MSDAPRRIDHAVLAVHDLDAAGAFYERLGFRVGARNRHPWGTENRLIQFASSFIELIAVGPEAHAIPDHEQGRFSFGAFVRDYLRRRAGFAMVVLGSDDARADAALFARKGIGSFEPFFFERKGRRPDGGETHVAFTLAFAADKDAPDAGFFVCQQHFPENFWSPSLQRHENGARGILAIGLTADEPQAHEAFLSAFSGATAQRDAVGGLSIALRGGRLDAARDASGPSGLRLDALSIAAPELEAIAARLVTAEIPFTRGAEYLSLAPEQALGVTLRFERSATRDGARG
jgi:catechol 2,3-dioxygenase-like lactoylglutathione lyase family enzyme